MNAEVLSRWACGVLPTPMSHLQPTGDSILWPTPTRRENLPVDTPSLQPGARPPGTCPSARSGIDVVPFGPRSRKGAERPTPTRGRNPREARSPGVIHAGAFRWYMWCSPHPCAVPAWLRATTQVTKPPRGCTHFCPDRRPSGATNHASNTSCRPPIWVCPPPCRSQRRYELPWYPEVVPDPIRQRERFVPLPVRATRRAVQRQDPGIPPGSSYVRARLRTFASPPRPITSQCGDNQRMSVRWHPTV